MNNSGMRAALVGGAILCMGFLMETTTLAKSPKHLAHSRFKEVESIATMAPVLNTVENMHELSIEKTLSCKLTAYGPGFESTGKRPGDPGYMVTASGKMATPKRTIAVDPHLIPLGSLVYIDGIGYRVAEDVGGAVKGEHIDVYFPSDDEAVQFGVKRHVKVIVFHADSHGAKN